MLIFVNKKQDDSSDQMYVEMIGNLWVKQFMSSQEIESERIFDWQGRLARIGNSRHMASKNQKWETGLLFFLTLLVQNQSDQLG